jgi:PBSX family phage portal protein
MEFVNDDNASQEIEIKSSYDTWSNFTKSSSVDLEEDPFASDISDLKKLGGLSPAFKRKASREINKSFTGRENSGTQQNLMAQAITGYAMFDLVMPPFNLDYLSRIYEMSTYNYSAINAKVANIVGLGYGLVETRKTNEALDGITSPEQLDRARRKINKLKQDLQLWIDSTNDEDTFTETLVKVYTDLETTGNGYIEIGRTVAGDIGYIGHIPAKTMRVRRLRDGFIQILYGKVVYFRNFGDLDTPSPITSQEDRPNEVIHLKKYTPMNNYYGIADIAAAQNALAGNEFAGKYNLDYFENKAVPRYIITVKGAKLSPEAERKLLEFFQVGLKGKNHRSLYIPLPADTPDSKVDFKMEPIEAGSQESSFNKYRQANRDEILLAHRVPISKIGIPEGINLAAARDADKTFREQVCKPAQDILAKKINKIIEEKTDALIIKFNELTLTDEDTQSKIDERYLRMQVITPNEVRVRKGMVPLDGGDEVVELHPQQAAEQTAQAGNTRQRTQDRSSNSPDKSGEARQPKGDGRATP